MYSNSEMRAIIDFPVEMRAAPTFSSNDNSNSFYFQRDSNADFFNNLSGFNITKTRASVRNNTDMSGTAGHAGMVAQENGYSNLNFSAEL